MIVAATAVVVGAGEAAEEITVAVDFEGASTITGGCLLFFVGGCDAVGAGALGVSSRGCLGDGPVEVLDLVDGGGCLC